MHLFAIHRQKSVRAPSPAAGTIQHRYETLALASGTTSEPAASITALGRAVLLEGCSTNVNRLFVYLADATLAPFAPGTLKDQATRKAGVVRANEKAAAAQKDWHDAEVKRQLQLERARLVKKKDGELTEVKTQLELLDVDAPVRLSSESASNVRPETASKCWQHLTS